MITHFLAADMCRRAAARIRELAEAATPGPWKATGYCGVWLVGHPHGLVFTQEHDDDCGFAENDQADAEHIAAWSPPPAIAVAELLELAADEIEALSLREPAAPLPAMLMAAARIGEAFLLAQPKSPDSSERIEALLSEARAAQIAARNVGDDAP